MTVRRIEDLVGVPEPAWPHVLELIRNATVPVKVLDVDPSSAERVLFRLQVTAASTLGALALNCGGLLVDHGWLRLLGGGTTAMPDLAGANGITEPSLTTTPPLALTVAYDVLGGRFAINGGELPGELGEVAYWGPDTLDWTALGAGHSAFVSWALSGGSIDFYSAMRWPSWEDEVSAVSPGQGIAVYPPLFSAEGKDIARATHRAVPFAELLEWQGEIAGQVAHLPPGSAVRFDVTE